MLLVDYFSRYVETAQLSPTHSANVTVHLKSIFAHRGIPETPEILITDNGPHVACQEMKDFADEDCFEHVTRSPRYSQSNGGQREPSERTKTSSRKPEIHTGAHHW